ncbi:MAG: CapA family protein [Dehalococcoidia bacterium]|nr:CapA family protein [Dehalococcoidia bacterium]
MSVARRRSRSSRRRRPNCPRSRAWWRRATTCLCGAAWRRIEQTGDWTSIFQTDLGDYLREADLALTSQDGSIQDFSEPYRCVDIVNLTSPPGAIEALEFAGIDGATVATNHIFDCGQTSGCGSRAFEQTLELLDEAGIKTAGGGMNLEEALEPAIFEVGDRTFGMLGFDDIAAGNPTFLGAEEDAPGTAPMDDSYDDEYAWNPNAAAFYAPAEMLETTRMERTIREAKEEVDFLIVMINSGTEDSHDPGQYTNRSIKGLRAAADAGADLVIGNQAHHVQAAEVRDGTFIGYALGNFVYDQVHSVEHTQCYLAEASFWEDRLAAMRLLPCQIHDYYQPRFVDEQTRLKILGDVWGAAANLPASVE